MSFVRTDYSDSYMAAKLLCGEGKFSFSAWADVS